MFLPCRPCCGGALPTTCDEWRRIPASGTSEKVAIKLAGLPNLLPAGDFSSVSQTDVADIPYLYSYKCGWMDLAFFNYHPITLYYAGFQSSTPQRGCVYYSASPSVRYSSSHTWTVYVDAPLSSNPSDRGTTLIEITLAGGSCEISIEIDGFIKWDEVYTASHPDVIAWSAVTCDGQTITSTSDTPNVTLDISSLEVTLLSATPAIAYRPCSAGLLGDLVSSATYISNLSLDGVSADYIWPWPMPIVPPACESFASADCSFGSHPLYPEDQLELTISSLSLEHLCGGSWYPWPSSVPSDVLTTYTLDWYMPTADLFPIGPYANGASYHILDSWGWALPWFDLPTPFGNVYGVGVLDQMAISLTMPARVNTIAGSPVSTSSSRSSILAIGFKSKYAGSSPISTIYGGISIATDSYSCKNFVTTSGSGSVTVDPMLGAPLSCPPAGYSTARPSNNRMTLDWSISQA